MSEASPLHAVSACFSPVDYFDRNRHCCVHVRSGFDGSIIGVLGQGFSQSHGQGSDGSNGTEQEQQQQLISSGVSALLTKPLETAAVRNALRGR